MMPRNGDRIHLIAVPAFILALLVIPCVSDATWTPPQDPEVFTPLNSGPFHMPPWMNPPARDSFASNVIMWMQYYAGKEVTAREYLTVVNPGYLDSQPQDIRETYSWMKVRVPDPRNPDEEALYGLRRLSIAYGAPEGPEDEVRAYMNDYSRECVVNRSLIAVSDSLVDQRMTAAAYLTTVCPAHFFGLPESVRSSLDHRVLTVSNIPARENVSVHLPTNSFPDPPEHFLKEINPVIYVPPGLQFAEPDAVWLGNTRAIKTATMD
ncbi:hypothetical protein [Methanoregula sp.]|uniref:hypothetical protein n=1 Tax=Methanoregula sp. TaxID=2052170 RepID=UPI003564E357